MNVLQELLHLLPEIARDVGIALLPVVAVFAIFQLTLLKLSRERVIKMLLGIGYAYIGLVLFFLGIEIGFSDMGQYLGETMGQHEQKWILLPIGLGIGFSVVLAEPAVRSLVQQVENVTGGTIKRAAIYASLCISVAVAVALAMFRAMFEISFWAFIIPGYAIALILAKFTSPLFTAIAFDAGGVATGPMTTTFVLSFTVGVTLTISDTNSATDAFGVVALVAMMPLITVQVLGLIFERKARMAENAMEDEDTETKLELLMEGDDDEEEMLFDGTMPEPVLDNSAQSAMMDSIQADADEEGYHDQQ